MKYKDYFDIVLLHINHIGYIDASIHKLDNYNSDKIGEGNSPVLMKGRSRETQ